MMATTVKGLSLTVLICLSITGCSTFMESSKSPAPVDTMGVGTTVTPQATTVQSTTVTTTSNSSAAISGNVGGDIGKLSDADAVKVNQVLEANKTGQITSWNDAGTSTTFSVTPTRTFASPTGEPCRDFTTTAANNGQTKQSYGTACRDSNGQWHIVSS